MIKLSLSPDLRFANDKLVNRKATITLGKTEFNGTFSIMPASASTQAAITAEGYFDEEHIAINRSDLAKADNNKVKLTANVIKTVHFKKGQTLVDTGIEVKAGEQFTADGYTISESSRNTLTVERAAAAATEAETAEVELMALVPSADKEGEFEPASIPVAAGRLVGNTMGFVINGGKEAVRIHALCNWMGHTGLKENLESFKMVKKDHDALVLTLATNSVAPDRSEVYESTGAES